MATLAATDDELLAGLDGRFGADGAREILKLRFSTAQRERMDELAAKARAGTLTAEEADEAERFERVGGLLSILKSRARIAAREDA